MNFSKALEELKQGKCIKRSGWNGTDMFAYYITDNYSAMPESLKIPNGVMRNALGLVAADGSFGPWVPSTSDLLGEDWEVVTY